MLVLTRKVGEGIAIGDDIKIVVMQIKGKQVRLGIKADASTIVHREEIYQKIQDENRMASKSDAASLDSAKGLFSGESKDEKTPLRRLVRKKSNSEDDS